ncbi:Os12g0266601 [Oryza sativa Japonica Group]|uniref:Os12g0266601 protein n=1 Tax=Oryza sativa subsp. japonica TaxID=39947 RepID=A0A0P0Y943_ORYSJ|nr:Os12g0266601 [Oryza sativa Japonica Group]
MNHAASSRNAAPAAKYNADTVAAWEDGDTAAAAACSRSQLEPGRALDFGQLDIELRMAGLAGQPEQEDGSPMARRRRRGQPARTGGRRSRRRGVPRRCQA